ncbi:histidine phosphatase family protein [uncultured Sphingomonas sp.]|uniref:histidine phosphatase family protein n=1 Tax=uncultured Sphingomonas sp. TaxID=158754 RepID=UPI0025EC6465|nr:histidine phosphatase family protein [uncultured Sphingomonas sp.]
MLSGRSDIALSERGRAEADALARRLGTVPLASLHSSPRPRTRQTAEAVASRHALPLQIAPALDEIDFGDFTGRSFADLDALPDWRRWNAERHTARCPDGETMAEAVERALAYLMALPEGDCPALCVTHCDIIRGLVTRLLGLPYDRMFALECDPGSLTTLQRDQGGLHLITLNEQPFATAHSF